ncbi:hypothetical protein FACS1894174_07750 [Bacteroidia bacterium]|nr:hypothetical protein FACS189455_3590 [Bacteroidia bacterium]GHV22736.1 hypothetical protein FACS1894174_07750 [Bacteroidia bacterium]
MSDKRRRYKKHPYSERLQVVSKVLDERFPIRTTAKLFDANQFVLVYDSRFIRPKDISFPESD